MPRLRPEGQSRVRSPAGSSGHEPGSEFHSAGGAFHPWRRAPLGSSPPVPIHALDYVVVEAEHGAVRQGEQTLRFVGLHLPDEHLTVGEHELIELVRGGDGLGGEGCGEEQAQHFLSVAPEPVLHCRRAR